MDTMKIENICMSVAWERSGRLHAYLQAYPTSQWNRENMYQALLQVDLTIKRERGAKK